MASASRHAARFVKQGLFLRAGGRAAPVLGPFGSCLQEDNGHGPTQAEGAGFFRGSLPGGVRADRVRLLLPDVFDPEGLCPASHSPIHRARTWRSPGWTLYRANSHAHVRPRMEEVKLAGVQPRWDQENSGPIPEVVFNCPGWQAHSGRRFIAQGLRSPKSRPRLSLPVWSYTAPGLRR